MYLSHSEACLFMNSVSNYTIVQFIDFFSSVCPVLKIFTYPLEIIYIIVEKFYCFNFHIKPMIYLELIFMVQDRSLVS